MTKIDPQKMMAQIGQMQKQMEVAQEELKTQFVEHSAGGGAVTVKASGALEIVEITIKPEAIDPDDANVYAIPPPCRILLRSTTYCLTHDVSWTGPPPTCSAATVCAHPSVGGICRDIVCDELRDSCLGVGCRRAGTGPARGRIGEGAAAAQPTQGGEEGQS